MGEIVYLKDRRPTAPGQIIANLERARQDMVEVEKTIDEHLRKAERGNRITLRHALTAIGLGLLIVAFIIWRIKYGA